jgi:O-antigen/teichoic acid export membrane protein
MNPAGTHPGSAADLAVEETVTAGDQPALPLPPPDAPRPAVVRGAAWTVGGFVALQVLRFAFNLLLTRLVAPQVFGVMNLVSLLLLGLHMFSDLGIRQCVINSPRGDEARFLNTAWTLQVIRGFALWAAAVALARPLARLYETPAMVWLLPLVGLVCALEGLTATAAFTLSRHLERGKLVAREVGAYVVSMGGVVVCLLALRRSGATGDDLAGRQMFAFAAGNVFSAVVELATSYLLIRGARNWFAWDRAAARAIITLGGWIALSAGCSFLASNLDRLYVGKLDKAVLANYNLAAQLAAVPVLLLNALGHQLLFPLYSRLNRDGVPLSESFRLLHTATTGCTAWLTAGAFAVCPTLVFLVYPPAYHDAADYVRWLGVAAWFTVLQTSSEVVLLALGRFRRVATGQFIKLSLLVPFLLAGYHFGGFFGVIAGYVAAEAVRYVVLSSALAQEGLPVFRIDLALTLLLSGTAVVTILAGPALHAPGASRVMAYGTRLVGEALVLTACWAALLALWWTRHGRALRALVQLRRAA